MGNKEPNCVLKFKKFMEKSVNKKINMLTLTGKFIHEKAQNKNKTATGYKYLVEVLCDCGNQKLMNWYYIKSGDTKSCGCLGKLSSIKTLEKYRKANPVNIRKLPEKIARIRRMIRRYKSSAKIRGFNYELSDQRFEELACSNCHYCNKEHLSDIPKELDDLQIFNGIDRKYNKIGYTLENCVACCTHCNFLKKDYDYDVFIATISVIYNNLKSKDNECLKNEKNLKANFTDLKYGVLKKSSVV
jgi:hypothetical protein